jgi:hypothetical protein
MTSNNRTIRIRAAQIRKTFETHSEMVRFIVAGLSDEELIRKADEHHTVKCDLIQARAKGGSATKSGRQTV